MEATNITIKAGMVNGDLRAVMNIDGVEYVHAKAWSGPMAHQCAQQLVSDFGVESLIGMAFDYVHPDMPLTVYPDTKAVGLYIKVEDLEKTFGNYRLGSIFGL